MSEPASYGDVTAEYLALRRTAGLVAGGHDLVWAVGDDVVAFLDGQLSQDVAAMAPGSVARSLLLEPRGKLRALLWLLRGEDRVGIIADAGLGPRVVDELSRYLFRVDVELIADDRSPLALWGPGSAEVLAGAGLAIPGGWAESDDELVAAVPLNGLPRYLVAGVERESLVSAGATPVGTVAAASVRIEGGEPVMDVDVDERTIPQETGLVPASVSFTKGCFLGQELVARIDARGHINRRLVGITLRENVLPPPGAVVAVDGDTTVGEITSVGESLQLRAPVALAVVRREVADGGEVEIVWEGGAAAGTVHELPLDDFAESVATG